MDYKPKEIPLHATIVTDVRIPFRRMMEIIFEIILAAIPAMIVAAMVITLVVFGLSTVLRGGR